MFRCVKIANTLIFHAILLVDGEWSSWSPWLQCDVLCGGGERYRVRSCDGIAHGGAGCDGVERDTGPCNTHPCPSKLILKSFHLKFKCD